MTSIEKPRLFASKLETLKTWKEIPRESLQIDMSKLKSHNKEVSSNGHSEKESASSVDEGSVGEKPTLIEQVNKVKKLNIPLSKSRVNFSESITIHSIPTTKYLEQLEQENTRLKERAKIIEKETQALLQAREFLEQDRNFKSKPADNADQLQQIEQLKAEMESLRNENQLLKTAAQNDQIVVSMLKLGQEQLMVTLRRFVNSTASGKSDISELFHSLVRLASEEKVTVHKEVSSALLVNREPLADTEESVLYKVTYNNNECVMKITKQADNPHQYQDFLKEIAVLSLVDHPHVMKCIGAFTSTNEKGYLMSYFPHSLRSYLAYLTHEQCVGLALEIAQALNYLHVLKVCHRDIKPGNILIIEIEAYPMCRAVLSDFGATKPLDLQSGYMAPEVLQGSTYTEKADIFSFAMIMVSMLNKHPAIDVTPAAIVNGERPNLPSDCDARFAAIIHRCWAQSPSERASITEIVEALKEIQPVHEDEY